MLNGDELMRAPKEDVEAYISNLAVSRGYPPQRRSLKHWTNMQVLSPGMKSRVKDYPNAIKDKAGLLDITQTGSWSTLSDHVPALLRRT
eukprot:12303066-Alexandrium_andersonii.AAC.1